MPTYALTIDGVAKSLKLGSLSVREGLNNRGALNLAVQSLDGSYRVQKNKGIVVTEDGTRIFAGYTDVPSEQSITDAGTGVQSNVSATCNKAYAARRYVQGTVVAGTVKQFLQWLLPYLTPFSVTLYGSQVDGPSLPELALDGTAEDALNTVAGLSGYVWDLDYDLVLSMKLPASISAPFSISSMADVIGDVTVEPITTYYANRIVLRYSSVATPAYCYMVVTSSNFADGDVVKVGNTDYTYRNSPSATNDVQIGANSDASLQNLAAKITATGLCWSYYGTGWWGSTHGLKIQAVAPGASGNSIVVSSTNPIGVFRTEGSTSVVSTLVLGSDASLSNVAVADDYAEQASEGLWEKAISDPSITDAAVAQAAANAYLAKSVINLVKLTYVKICTGIHPGMTQSITLATKAVSGMFIITDVEVFDLGDGNYARRVSATGGTATPYLWQDDAKQLYAGGGGGASPVTYGGGGTTTVLSSPFPLGGARERSVGCGTTPAPVLDYQTYEATASFAATLRVEVKSYDAGVAVTPGLYNMSDDTWTWGSAVTNTAFQSQDVVVFLTAGKMYRLGVKTDNANGDAYCIGKLVA